MGDGTSIVRHMGSREPVYVCWPQGINRQVVGLFVLTKEIEMKNVYQAGMQLANALRLIGRHEDAHAVEVWVLDLTKEKAND